MAAIASTSVLLAAQEPSAVLVRGGTFRMGTAASAIPELRRRYNVNFPGAFEDEVPDRVVTVGSFRLDRFEVTNAGFAAFAANHAFPPDKANHPVVNVTWQQARAYCASVGGRLPSEAEWEYAARSGRDDEFPWGDEPPSPARANYAASGIGDTRPVGSYAPNAAGLYDMAGNVWEWTADAWNGRPGGEERRVIRGASFAGGIVNLRTRWRDSHVVTNAVAFVGFRCAY